MTRIFAVLISALLLFTGTAFAESVDWGDLVERNGVVYKKFTDEPFSGEATGLQSGELVNGKRNGPWVQYHENGQLAGKAIFQNGNAHGPIIAYFTNGQIGVKGNMKDGKRNGSWVEYYANGHLSVKINFTDGKKDGLSELFHHATGTLWMKMYYNNGILDGPSYTYHKNGQLSFKESYNNGKLDGPSYSYDENGQHSNVLYYYNGKLK